MEKTLLLKILVLILLAFGIIVGFIIVVRFELGSGESVVFSDEQTEMPTTQDPHSTLTSETPDTAATSILDSDKTIEFFTETMPPTTEDSENSTDEITTTESISSEFSEQNSERVSAPNSKFPLNQKPKISIVDPENQEDTLAITTTTSPSNDPEETTTYIESPTTTLRTKTIRVRSGGRGSPPYSRSSRKSSESWRVNSTTTYRSAPLPLELIKSVEDEPRNRILPKLQDSRIEFPTVIIPRTAGIKSELKENPRGVLLPHNRKLPASDRPESEVLSGSVHRKIKTTMPESRIPETSKTGSAAQTQKQNARKLANTQTREHLETKRMTNLEQVAVTMTIMRKPKTAVGKSPNKPDDAPFYWPFDVRYAEDLTSNPTILLQSEFGTTESVVKGSLFKSDDGNVSPIANSEKNVNLQHTHFLVHPKRGSLANGAPVPPILQLFSPPPPEIPGISPIIPKSFTHYEGKENYHWNIQNADGTTAEQRSYNRDDVQVLEGLYSFLGSDGLLYTARYENGYRQL